MQWAVFLRGINVGGRNKVAMADLRASLTAAGFADVQTHIQSGNIVFGSAIDDEERVCGTVRDVLESEHSLQVPVVARSIDALSHVAVSHPGLGGSVPDKWLHVALLDRAADASVEVDRGRFAPDSWKVAGREIYSTYPDGVGTSKLTIDVFEKAYGVVATARNVATIRAVVDKAA